MTSSMCWTSRTWSFMKKQSSPVMRWHSTTSGRLPGELGDLVQLAGGRPHADDHAQREAQRAGVELGAVAADDPGLLEPLQPLADGRGGQADPPAELRQAEAGVGLELQQQLATAHCPLPLIFITAHGEEGTRARALRAGAVAFLDKPFSDEVLLSAVQAALQSARGGG